jgi:hypothetical protein
MSEPLVLLDCGEVDVHRLGSLGSGERHHLAASAHLVLAIPLEELDAILAAFRGEA